MARFSEKLKALRRERNLTQDELAKILGTSKQVVSRYENDLRSPKIDVVAAYADRLGVPVDYLADNSLLQTAESDNTIFQHFAAIKQNKRDGKSRPACLIPRLFFLFSRPLSCLRRRRFSL